MIETKAGLLTMIVVEAEMELEVAEMVAVPCPELVARPWLPTVLLMTATDDDELQVATVVRSCVLPSLYVPVAVNCWEAPSAIDGFCGAMEIDSRVAAVTARVAVAFTDPDAAVIVIEPAPTPVARPCDLAESLIVATVPSDVLQ